MGRSGHIGPVKKSSNSQTHKIGAKVASRGRYITFQMAEVAVPRPLFVDIPGHCATARRQRDTPAGDAFLRSSGSNASACQGHARSARNNHSDHLMRRQPALEFKLQEAPKSENILT
jgi:hypothetical protein